MIYLQLFISFLQIGMFSFGGGYAAMPLIQGQVVTLHHWLSMEEFTDLITISQMTPGPIAVNSATFVGIKIAGIPGAAVATLGCILPSCVIVTLLAKLYLKYRNMGMLQGILGSLRPAVVAMIASAGISILITAFWGSRSAIPHSFHRQTLFLHLRQMLAAGNQRHIFCCLCHVKSDHTAGSASADNCVFHLAIFLLSQPKSLLPALLHDYNTICCHPHPLR